MSQSDPQHSYVRAVFSRTPDCPSLDDLAAIAAAPGNAAAADPHIGQCHYCSNEIALLRTFEAGASTPDEVAAVAWISANLNRRESPWRPRPSQSLWERLTAWIPAPVPRWLPAAAMACLLVIVGSGLYFSNRRPAGLPADLAQGSAWRSTSVALVAPSGDVSAPAEFSWRALDAATQYRVRLLDVDGAEIWSADTSAAQIAIPAPVRAQMQPGRSFRWQVTARNSAGPVAESALQSFHIF